MNDTADSRVGISVKGCGVVLMLAVIVLLVQAGLALFERMRGGGVDVPADVLLLSADARALSMLGRSGWEPTSENVPQRAIRAQMSERIQQLAAHPPLTATPDIMAMVVANWAEVEAAAGQLDVGQAEYTALLADLVQCLDQVETLREALDALVREMIASGSVASQVYLALHQLVLVDGMMQPLAIIRAGGRLDGGGVEKATAGLAEDIAAFERVLAGLRHGDAEMALSRLRNRRALAALEQAQAQWVQWRPILDRVMQQAPALPAMQAATRELERTVETLLDTLARLMGPPPQLRSGAWVRVLAGILALLSATGLWLASVQQRRYWMEHAASTRHREREALARLLDEMGALAEGDLSVQATVNAEPVGMLAEALNFAVEQLAAKVQAMNAAVARIGDGAEQARLVATQVSEVGHYQVQELTAAMARMEEVIASADALLAHMSVPGGEGTRPACAEAARRCAEGAADVAAMVTTLHTVAMRMEGENARALEALETLAQSRQELRQLAKAFVLPG